MLADRVVVFVAEGIRHNSKVVIFSADSFGLGVHAIKELNMHHTPHECRHTLATMLDRAGANETAVKMILGHARTGVTKGVYTHKTLADLRKAINKV